MTDVTTPEPEPTHTSRKRPAIIAAIVAVVVIAVAAGSYFYAASAGDGKASDYADDYAAWVKKDKPQLLKATDSLPSAVFPVKGDVYSTKSLASQKKACDGVADRRTRLEAAAERLPTVGGGGLLGSVSSDLSKAGDRSAQREKVVEAYAKQASAALAQVERDCRFNIKINTAGSKSAKLFEQSSKYLMKRGDREPNASCTQYETCVSSITSKKNKYADLRIKATKTYRNGGLKLWQSDECTATSYGKACATISSAYTKANQQQLKNYQYVRKTKSSINNPGISNGNKRLDEINQQNSKRIAKAVAALSPALKSNTELRKAPGWTEKFFTVAAKLAFGDLKEQRDAVDKL